MDTGYGRGEADGRRGRLRRLFDRLVRDVRYVGDRQGHLSGSLKESHFGTHLCHGHDDVFDRRAANLLLDTALCPSHTTGRLWVHVLLGPYH